MGLELRTFWSRRSGASPLHRTHTPSGWEEAGLSGGGEAAAGAAADALSLLQGRATSGLERGGDPAESSDFDLCGAASAAAASTCLQRVAKRHSDLATLLRAQPAQGSGGRGGLNRELWLAAAENKVGESANHTKRGSDSGKGLTDAQRQAPAPQAASQAATRPLQASLAERESTATC